jgi:hypothetical protein
MAHADILAKHAGEGARAALPGRLA